MERYLKTGFYFHQLKKGDKIKDKKINKILTIDSVGADEAFAKDLNGKSYTIKDLKKYSKVNEELIRDKETPERFIDLKGPSGNAYVILGMAHSLCKQLSKFNPSEYNWNKINKEMTSSDYTNLVLTFEKYFGDYVKIYNANVLDKIDVEDDEDDDYENIDNIDESVSEQRPLYVIAREIYRLWKPMSPYAKPYLEAMLSLDSVDDNYGMDSGDSIVRYFLGNASSWKGEDARRIKAELNKMI